MEGHRFARPSRGGGLIPRATAGLDRWLSRQNPAYRPALPKSTPSYRWGAFCVIHSLLFTIHMPCSKYRGIYNRGSRGRPLADVAIRPPCLLLWGNCHEVTERVKSPSSVSRLRGTREPPSPWGKALGTDCDQGESLEGATPALRRWFAMTHIIPYRSLLNSRQKTPQAKAWGAILCQKATEIIQQPR